MRRRLRTPDRIEILRGTTIAPDGHQGMIRAAMPGLGEWYLSWATDKTPCLQGTNGEAIEDPALRREIGTAIHQAWLATRIAAL